MKKAFVLLLSAFSCAFASGQTNTGLVKDAETNEPMAFASIGIVGKAVGTVSDNTGSYSLNIDDIYDNDTLRFSFIGYAPVSFKVSDYKNLASKDISLQRQHFEIGEVVVRPATTEEKILGNKFSKTMMSVGIKDSKGFECGVLLKIKKRAFLEELICNVSCTYDSISFRVNVYRQIDGNTFENILHEPIYINEKMQPARIEKGAKHERTTLKVDLTPYNITIESNTLVTLEYITDMGEGHIWFDAGLFGAPCYGREASHSNWKKSSFPIGMSVRAQVEK